MIRWFNPAIVILLLLSGNLALRAENILIYGTSKDYSGKTLEFYIYQERIFDSKLILSKVVADSSGNFSASFSLSETQCVYCQTPLYTAYIFAEPGKKYQVILPPLPGVQNDNIASPFFKPPLWHLLPSIKPGSYETELNHAIYNFDMQFEPFLDKQILRYYDPQYSREKLDSFVIANLKIPDLENDDYFVTYRFYKFAILGFMVNQFSNSDLYDLYLKEKPIRPDVPSWWEFFNLYFDKYFISLSGKQEFSALYSFIGNGDYNSLFQLLGKDPALRDTSIREWVILEEIHNAFYENGLPLNTLSSFCDSLSAHTKDPVNILIAEKIKKSASALLVGNLPPSARIFNDTGDTLDLSKLHGKYTYIGFCSLDNLSCQQEFEYLKYFYHKHSEYLDIIVILPGSETDQVLSFSDQNSIPWKFWQAKENSQILEDYKVMAFPVFYLLDRDGKLIMSPAILPSDGFEQRLFSILKARKEI